MHKGAEEAMQNMNGENITYCFADIVKLSSV